MCVCVCVGNFGLVNLRIFPRRGEERTRGRGGVVAGDVYGSYAGVGGEGCAEDGDRQCGQSMAWTCAMYDRGGR